ncbi:hypothetical protein WAI453_011821 [Rhynchosporium graminicola]|uniref:Related to RNA-3`-phosphate cyclase 1 n=1 Tax=Rhynchosporium graminicola TaxID=2792576 RepID=A0A1E1K0U6_9HELO|nr:related to RNA-3`-phosphate cyclase 1 [Rhynchosporium commune]
MLNQKVVILDGRTGEGGGQLVRVAIALAALTGTPIRIENVRGKRGSGVRGGGLKAQHVSCIQCLAKATEAEVTGCFVGSKTIEFKANLSPDAIKNRNIIVKAESAASILLVFQAVLPFFLFASDESGSPITITIQGGSNVSFSLSYEYLDQVLLPSLERFGIRVKRELEHRGWSHGTYELGSAKFMITPLPFGQPIKEVDWPVEHGSISRIDVSYLVLNELQATMREALTKVLAYQYPSIEVNFVLEEDSRHRARFYALLVAHTTKGFRVGCDWLYGGKTKVPSYKNIVLEMAKKVVADLDAALMRDFATDEYLQDQMVVFQALAQGRSRIVRGVNPFPPDEEELDLTFEPFGHGSLHTTTARWVASQLLPDVKWYNEGRICYGVGWKVASDLTS